MNQRDYPIANCEWKRIISIPCHAGVTDNDIDYVVYWIKQYFSEQKKPWWNWILK